MTQSSRLSGRLARIALIDVDDVSPEVIASCEADSHADVRLACTRAFYSQMTLAVLKKRLLDTDPVVRYYAVQGLAAKEWGGGVEQLLLETLRLDPSAKVRAAAAGAGRRLGTDALLALIGALEDPNQGVRLAALKGLSDLPDGAGYPRLKQISQEKMGMMSLGAAAELSRAGLEVGVERLNDALVDERPLIREAALLRLERSRFPERFERTRQFLKDKSPVVVLTAARLLLQQNELHSEIKDALGGIIKKGVSEKGAARDMLVSLGDSSVVDDVRAALKNPDAALVDTILTRTQGAALIKDDVVSLLGDTRETVRIAAAKWVIYYMSKI